MISRQYILSPIVAAAIAALTLGACSRNDDRGNTAMTKAQRQTQVARADANPAVDSAQQATNDASSKVAGAITDAAITTSVTAELARDGSLDATRIDVDTAQGHVVLRGSAPDADAKDRAKRIALAVNGVRGVDNYLTVSPKS